MSNLLQHKVCYQEFIDSCEVEIYSDISYEMLVEMLQYPQCPEFLLVDIITYGEIELKKAAIRHPNCKTNALMAGLQSGVEIRRMTAFHKNMTEQLLLVALDDEDVLVRRIATYHCNRTKAVLHKAIRDLDTNVRRCAKAYKPNANNLVA